MATRRELFRNSLLGGVAMGLPKNAQAEAINTEKIIFITCFGGWDPTRVLVPAFDNPIVHMEDLAELWNIGNLQLVDHPHRPSVRQFFEANHQRCAIMNGILSPSVSHQACLELMRTGAPNGFPDWPTLLARDLFSDMPIPHLAISGDVFSGNLGSLVTRMGNSQLLESLLDDSLYEWSDVLLGGVDSQLIIAEQEVRLRRMGRLAENTNRDVFQNALESAVRAQYLKEHHWQVNWDSDGSLLSDCLLAVDVLEQGISSCISIGHSALWDSHSNNEVYQHWLWEELFSALDTLWLELSSRQTPSGPLSEQCTVVVLSEMGRAPCLNSSLGKDHWPYTSALIMSPFLTESRVIGGYDAQFHGLPLNLSGAEYASDGILLSPQHFGASIVQLMGGDAQELLFGIDGLKL